MTSAPVTVHSFLCPQGNLDPHCDHCRITGNRVGWEPAGKRDFCPPSPGLLSHIRSPSRGLPGGLLPGPLPVPVFYHPLMLSFLTCLFLTPGLLELPLPPQRPLQKLEGMGFSSFSCLAVGTPHHAMPLAFLRCHSPSSLGGSGSQVGLGGCGSYRLCSHSGDSKLSTFPENVQLWGVTVDTGFFSRV